MSKPVVIYAGVAEFFESFLDYEKEFARVYAINHPCMGNPCYVITSPIVSKDGDGHFETKNTIYRPAGVAVKDFIENPSSVLTGT